MLWKQTAVFWYRNSQVGKMLGIIRDDNSAEVIGVSYFHTSLRLMYDVAMNSPCVTKDVLHLKSHT
jgi:hypothetical protein